jgi:two-component system, OmpR family, alkaline phosphatase synthesis response regulator PhoP
VTPPREPARILIVEDDPSIATGLALTLKIEGYAASAVEDGEAALEQVLRDPPDLVLLDISLPGKDGLAVLSELRGAGDSTPVVVLSARQDEFDKVAALRLGADDYVTKPFAVAELMARVAAVLRRAGIAWDQASRAGVATTGSGLVVDFEARSASLDGAEVKLTHLEFELLAYFLRNPGKALGRDLLLRDVWGLRHAGSRRTVDNFIAQLRAKIERDPENPRHLLTVRGSGYRFVP